MARVLCRVLAGLLLLAWTGFSAGAEEQAAWAALSSGTPVALMRHTDAPGSAGDPPGFTLDDCGTQRNLSAKGRSDAEAAGVRLKAQGVRFGKIISSPWCRCVDTARLMNMGEVDLDPTFGNAFVLRERAADLAEGARRVIRQWHGPGPLLVVTTAPISKPSRAIAPRPARSSSSQAARTASGGSAC